MNTFIEIDTGHVTGKPRCVNVAHITDVFDSFVYTTTKPITTTHSYDELLEMIQKATPGINRLKSK